MGHHVTGQQLITAVDLVPGRPVLNPHHEFAEAAGEFLQPLDAGDAVVGGADDPLVVVNHVVHDLVPGDVRSRVAQGLAEVFGDHSGAAFPDVFESLLFGVG